MSQINSSVQDRDGGQAKRPDTTMVPELQPINHMPLKKRPTYQDQQDSTTARKKGKAPLDARRLEARRRSNRLSAQRARVRTKATIKALEDGKNKMQEINRELHIQLEHALAQNHALKRLMNVEASDAFARSRALTRALDLRTVSQNSRNALNRLTMSNTSPLNELAEAATAQSFQPVAPRPYPAAPVVQNDRRTETTASTSFQPDDKTPVDVQIINLQQEIKSLKNTMQKQS